MLRGTLGAWSVAFVLGASLFVACANGNDGDVGTTSSPSASSSSGGEESGSSPGPASTYGDTSSPDSIDAAGPSEAMDTSAAFPGPDSSLPAEVGTTSSSSGGSPCPSCSGCCDSDGHNCSQGTTDDECGHGTVCQNCTTSGLTCQS